MKEKKYTTPLTKQEDAKQNSNCRISQRVTFQGSRETCKVRREKKGENNKALIPQCWSLKTVFISSHVSRTVSLKSILKQSGTVNFQEENLGAVQVGLCTVVSLGQVMAPLWMFPQL